GPSSQNALRWDSRRVDTESTRIGCRRFGELRGQIFLVRRVIPNRAICANIEVRLSAREVLLAALVGEVAAPDLLNAVGADLAKRMLTVIVDGTHRHVAISEDRHERPQCNAGKLRLIALRNGAKVRQLIAPIVNVGVVETIDG